MTILSLPRIIGLTKTELFSAQFRIPVTIKQLSKRVLLTISAMILLTGCASTPAQSYSEASKENRKNSDIEIRTRITIDASPAVVYQVLSDFDNYPNWNPYHRKVTGEFKQGAQLEVEILRPDGKKISIPPHLLKITENREITWGGGIKGIFYGEHRFILQETSEGKTLLLHDEDFNGIAVQFADLPPEVLTEGYQQTNQALKRYIESQKMP